MANLSFTNIYKLRELITNINQNPHDINLLKALCSTIRLADKDFVKVIEKPLIACFYPYMNIASDEKQSLSTAQKELLIETLHELFRKLSIDSTTLFFNFYHFIVFELYDYTNKQVLKLSEEYTLAVVNCMICLIQSVSVNIILDLYNKPSVGALSQIVFVCCELAKREKSREIRSVAIKCILALAKVSDSDDFSDVVLRDKISQMFIFFLPGISNSFTEIVMDNVHVGHQVLSEVVIAYGRIISVVMQDYSGPEDEFAIKHGQTNQKIEFKWKNKQDFDDYLRLTERNVKWYKDTDANLNQCLKKFAFLTHCDHVLVKLQLVNMVSEISSKCFSTMPQSITTLVEFLIVLSQDANPGVSKRSREVISGITSTLSSDNLQSVFECLSDGFYNAINSLPRKFNSVDDSEKTSALSLLTGYVKLFGEYKLQHVLQSPELLNKLMQGLLHVSQLDTAEVQLLEAYSLKDLNVEPDLRTPWIKFHYFKDDDVKSKLEILCKELATSYDNFQIIFDFLYDTFLYDAEKQKEAVYLLNALILGLRDPSLDLLKTILDLYTDESYNLQDALDTDEQNPEEVKSNVVMICLLTEGIGKISLVFKQEFRRYLLKCLYSVLEKAGNGNNLISTAGLLSVNNITYSCGYTNTTALINANFDFLSYQVQRKLTKFENKIDVLNVLSVVFRYCTKDILLPMSNIVEEILIQTCDRFKYQHIDSYLSVFKMFISGLRRWFNIMSVNEPIKSRKQKEMEFEQFKVTGINYTDDFSDDIMEGKTAEELYMEDMEKKTKEEEENDDVIGYQKPKPPIYIKLTSSILKRTLHFLPAKKRDTKLLVLKILDNGIEILRDWEDELLPIVHQTWSPLVQRFKEDSDPLIMRLSVNLLATLARLSKDFIRMRTVKEALPSIKDTLVKMTSESYLKNRGSAYRYSQKYKLQLTILQDIGPILAHLDLDSTNICDFMDAVLLYLSNKQPKELQGATLTFFQSMVNYDSEVVQQKISHWMNATADEYEANIERVKSMIAE